MKIFLHLQVRFGPALLGLWVFGSLSRVTAEPLEQSVTLDIHQLQSTNVYLVSLEHLGQTHPFTVASTTVVELSDHLKVLAPFHYSWLPLFPLALEWRPVRLSNAEQFTVRMSTNLVPSSTALDWMFENKTFDDDSDLSSLPVVPISLKLDFETEEEFDVDVSEFGFSAKKMSVSHREDEDNDEFRIQFKTDW